MSCTGDAVLARRNVLEYLRDSCADGKVPIPPALYAEMKAEGLIREVTPTAQERAEAERWVKRIYGRAG